jgi:hypothetical protein
LHVPKSGGSSVMEALRASLNGALFHAHERAHRTVPLEYLLDRYSVVAGHFTFAQLSPAILQNTFLFTVLREPVDRAVSLYYFYRAQSTSSDLDPRVATAKALDLPAFVERLPKRISPWSNWQTFIFSGARNCEQPAHELLAAAIDNLRRMTLVGVSDELDALTRRIGELRGWSLCPPVTRMNVTPHRVPLDRIDPEVAQRLAELNDCDRQLFASARTLWERTKAVQPEPLHTGESTTSAPVQLSTSEHGTKQILITGIQVVAERSEQADEVYVGERLRIRIRGYSRITASDVTIGIRIDDHLGMEVYGVNTRLLELCIRLTAGHTFAVMFSLNANLAPGIYHVTAAVHAGADHLHRCFHWIDNAISFECRVRSPRMFSGMYDLQATATFEAVVNGRGALGPENDSELVEGLTFRPARGISRTSAGRRELVGG